MKFCYTYVFTIVLSIFSAQSGAENTQISVLFVGDASSSAYLGVQQGLTEANLQGQFLGQEYILQTTNSEDIDTDLVNDSIAIITTTDSMQLKQLADTYPDIPVINLSNDDDALRKNCAINLLHIAPSAQMKADALSQWKEKNPDSNNAVAQAWHPKFVKFAARDLNKRFKKAHNSSMDDDAWAGWAAVKMVSDTVARDNITEPSKMLDFLMHKLQFDGQKGLEMSFRDTGQLKQIILIVDEDKIVAEAPIRGVAKPPTVDSLGKTHCDPALD